MKKEICKFIVILFFNSIVGGILALCSFANKNATQIVLEILGMFCICWLVEKIVDWLFEDKSEVADNE
jgi:hypothetical protein